MSGFVEHLKGAGPSGEIGFLDVVQACLNSAEFMGEYRRLTGEMLQEKRAPIDIMIDRATGNLPHNDDELLRFFAAVDDLIWQRLPVSAFVV